MEPSHNWQLLLYNVATMFAAPGWSVSIDRLKAQEHPSGRSPQNVNAEEKRGAHLKRRKTGPKQSSRVDITGDNLGELWEKYVEGKTKNNVKGAERDGTQPQTKKRRRTAEDQSTEAPTTLGKGLDQEDHGSGKQVLGEELKEVSGTGNDEHIDAIKNADNAATGQERKEIGKANYEARIRKKREKERLRASGEVPPPRPPRQSEEAQSSWTSVHERTAKKTNSKPLLNAKHSKEDTPLIGNSFESPDTRTPLKTQTTTEDPNAPNHPPPPTKPPSKRKTKSSPKSQPPHSSAPLVSSPPVAKPPPRPHQHRSQPQN